MNFRTALSFEIDSHKYTYNIELDEFRSNRNEMYSFTEEQSLYLFSLRLFLLIIHN